MFEQLLKIIEKLVSRAGTFLSQKLLSTADDLTPKLSETIKETIDKSSALIRGKLFPDAVENDMPLLARLFKNTLNIKNWALLKSTLDIARLKTLIPEEKIPNVIQILFGGDSLKTELKFGPEKIVFDEWRNLSIDEKLDKLAEYVKKLDFKEINVLNRWKDITDKIGSYMEKSNRWKSSYETSFLSLAKQKLTENQFLKLQNILDDLTVKTGKQWSLWNLYFPHSPNDLMQLFDKVVDKDAADEVFKEILKFGKITGQEGSKIRAFWSRSREGNLFEINRSFYDALGFLEYSYDYITRANALQQRAFHSVDLLKEMNTAELNEFFKFLDYAKSKAVHGSVINSTIPLDLILQSDDFPLLKNFFQQKLKEGYFTRHLLKKDDVLGIVLMDYRSVFPTPQKHFEHLAEIILEELGESDHALESGIKDKIFGERRYFLISNDHYNVIKRIRDARYLASQLGVDDEIVRRATKFWKKTVTFYTRFVPWRLGNSIGDFTWNLFLQPTSLRKVVEAWTMTKDIVKGKLPEKLLQFEDELVAAGVVFGDPEFAIMNVAPNKMNIFHYLQTKMQEISQRMEVTPKLASFLDNLEKVERGETPDLTGASKWIKEMFKKEPWKISAIAERASELTIDYTAMPPQFRKNISQLLAPFAYWYVKSIDKMAHLFVSKDGFPRAAAMTILPMTLAYLWNNSSPDRKAVWEALPPYAKFFSVVAGIDKTDPKRPKPIVVNIYGPGQMVADFLGFDIAFDLAKKVKDGVYSPDEAVGYWLFNSPVKFAKKFLGLVNPLGQALIILGTNHDPFLNRDIVPQNLVGTPEGNKLLFDYAAQRVLFSPIVPSMMAGTFSDSIDFLKRIYSEKDLSLVREFLEEYGDRFINPLRAFTLNPDAVRYYMSYAAYTEQQEMRKELEAYLQRMYKALIKGDTDKFKDLYERVLNGDFPFINAHDVELYFNRPSTQAKFIKDVIIPTIKDPDIRKTAKELINQLNSLEALQYSRKSQRQYLQNYFLQSNYYLWGDGNPIQ